MSIIRRKHSASSYNVLGAKEREEAKRNEGRITYSYTEGASDGSSGYDNDNDNGNGSGGSVVVVVLMVFYSL